MFSRFRNSLTFKLIIAFVLVSIIEAAFISFFVQGRTASEFNRYQNNRDHGGLTRPLRRYYERADGWDDLEDSWFLEEVVFDNDVRETGVDYILLDENREVIIEGGSLELGEVVDLQSQDEAISIRVDGDTVGWLVVESSLGIDQRQYNELEELFLSRVRGAIFSSAVAAVILSAIAAVWFSRGFVRPLKELTHATQDMAKGNLQQEVSVRTKDEIGRLALSFNQMSADLAFATQQRRQMTADIAHDLRTPLSIILGYTEAMNEGKLKGNPEIYSAIHGEANMLKRLIDDLRTLALADAGELTLNLMAVPPRELIERTVLAYAGQAEACGVRLELNIAEKLPLVSADPERIAQVLGNLVSNALRYTAEGGSIELAAVYRSGDDQVCFQVKDTGSGIPADDLEHIFDRFYRADKAREQSSGQSGLGLAIAKSIVEAHQGEISATSEVGVGSVFTIVLPPRAAVAD